MIDGVVIVPDEQNHGGRGMNMQSQRKIMGIENHDNNQGDSEDCDRICLFPVLTEKERRKRETECSGVDGELATSARAETRKFADITTADSVVLVHPGAGMNVPPEITVEAASAVARTARDSNNQNWWAQSYRFPAIQWPGSPLEGSSGDNNINEYNNFESDACSCKIVVATGYSEKSKTLFGAAAVNSAGENAAGNENMIKKNHGLIGLSIHQGLLRGQFFSEGADNDPNSFYSCTLQMLEIAEEENAVYDLLSPSCEVIVDTEDAQEPTIETLDQLQSYVSHVQQAWEAIAATREDNSRPEHIRGHVLATVKVWRHTTNGDEEKNKTCCSMAQFLDSANLSPYPSSSSSDGDNLNSVEEVTLRNDAIRNSMEALGQILRGQLMKEGEDSTNEQYETDDISLTPYYEQSTLTEVLQPTLELPDAKIEVLSFVSNATVNYEETVETLKYASCYLYDNDAGPVKPGNPWGNNTIDSVQPHHHLDMSNTETEEFANSKRRHQQQKFSTPLHSTYYPTDITQTVGNDNHKPAPIEDDSIKKLFAKSPAGVDEFDLNLPNGSGLSPKQKNDRLVANLLTARDKAEAEAAQARQELYRLTTQHRDEQEKSDREISELQKTCTEMQVGGKELYKIADEAIAAQSALEDKVKEMDLALAEHESQALKYQELEKNFISITAEMEQSLKENEKYKLELEKRNAEISEVQGSVRDLEKSKCELLERQKADEKRMKNLRSALTQNPNPNAQKVGKLMLEMVEFESAVNKRENELLAQLKQEKNSSAKLETEIKDLNNAMLLTRKEQRRVEQTHQKEIKRLQGLASQLQEEITVSQTVRRKAENQVAAELRSKECLTRELEKTKMDLENRILDVQELSGSLKSLLDSKADDESEIATLKKKFDFLREDTQTKVIKIANQQDDTAVLLEKRLKEKHHVVEELADAKRELHQVLQTIQFERKHWVGRRDHIGVQVNR